MHKEVLNILGLFSSGKKQDLELLPPPPPFPDLAVPSSKPAQKEEVQERTKIVIRSKENVDDILAQTTQQEPEDFLSIDAPAVNEMHAAIDEQEISQAVEQAKKPVEQKAGFWKKLFTSRKKMPDMPAPQNNSLPLDEARRIQQPLSALDDILQKIQQARKHLAHLDRKAAKEAYVDIMKNYRLLTKGEQEQVYELICDLYEERKAAERMPK